MVVASDRMLGVLSTSRRVASSKITVLIEGETGPGQELVAHAIHDASPRRDRPFSPFNCSATSREMLDSQLFGYRRGAFTGAQEAFQGVIRAAAIFRISINCFRLSVSGVCPAASVNHTYAAS